MYKLTIDELILYSLVTLFPFKSDEIHNDSHLHTYNNSTRPRNIPFFGKHTHMAHTDCFCLKYKFHINLRIWGALHMP